MRYLLLLLAVGMPAICQENKSLEDLKKMDGFKKLLPKGKIPAVMEPQFITAQEAETMPDNAWVIGVYAQGVAKAYSINLLNRHEIVNDFVGDKPIATTW